MQAWKVQGLLGGLKTPMHDNGMGGGNNHRFLGIAQRSAYQRRRKQRGARQDPRRRRSLKLHPNGPRRLRRRRGFSLSRLARRGLG